MADNLTIINRVTEEHQRIRGHIKLAGESMNDMEAMFNLQNVYSGWTLSSMEMMTEKEKQLLQTISSLAEGLKNHFAFEEEALPPLFGEVLMQALILEHQKIREEINKAKSVVTDMRLEGLSQEEVLSHKSHVQQVIGSVSQMIEEHASKEEIVLRMIKRALEEKRR